LRTQFSPALRDGDPFLFQDAGAQSAGLFSKRLSRLRQGFVGQAEARAAIKRSRLDFVKAIFFQPEANPFKHRQLFFQVHH